MLHYRNKVLTFKFYPKMKRKSNLIGHMLCFLQTDEITDRPVKTLMKVIKFADKEKQTYLCKLRKTKQKNVRRIVVDRKQYESLFMPIRPKPEPKKKLEKKAVKKISTKKKTTKKLSNKKKKLAAAC